MPHFKQQPVLTGEFVHHRHVESMRAEMLTHVCKGNACSTRLESCTSISLCLSAPDGVGKELAGIILPSRQTYGGTANIRHDRGIYRVVYLTCYLLNTMYKVLSHVVGEIEQGTKSRPFPPRVSI